MKKIIISLMVLLSLVACSKGGTSHTSEVYTDDVVTISTVELPVYPNSSMEQQYGNFSSFISKDDVDIVKNWIETKMLVEGWRSYQDAWGNSGDIFSRDFQRGAASKNPAFGEENVKVLVGVNKGGGAYYSFSVISTGKK